MAPASKARTKKPATTAVAELVEEHGGLIYALGLRFCGNADEARDLVQDTFLQAFRKWDQFEGRSEPSTWLYRIAARACQRRHRRRAGEPRVLEPLSTLLPSGDETVVDVPSGDDGPLDLLLKKESLEAVEEAVAGLPEKFRIPLVLKEILELPVAEVARVLDVRESTVKTRLHRARLYVARALRQKLPRLPAPPRDHSKKMCLDLLKLKQESLDSGGRFPVPAEELCRRCRSLFDTLDLGQEACRRLRAGKLPPAVKEAIQSELAAPP
jgi:RNA polymerase sigma-70 factor (ECF subfamily)